MLAFPLDSRVEVVENPITHEPETQFDRAVSSQPMRHLIRKLFTTGIMPDLSDNYLVSAGSDGMTVVVHSGFAVVDGGLALETEDRTLEVTAADTTLDRIDTVVLRWNENVDVRTADLYVVSGTPAANPVRPELQRGESIYEIGLADIFITRSVATITNEKITDTRYEAERCGVVRSISEYDTTYIYQQVQADLASFKANEESTFATWSTAQQTAFEEWFETIQDILDENVAAHLQAEIDDLKKGTGVFYDTDAEAEADIANIEDGTIVYTNDGEDEPINARQIAYDDGTQSGSNVETQITQLNQSLTDNLGGTSDTFKFATDGNGNYGYVKKVSGADTFCPFKDIKKIGTYSNNTTINISAYGATDVSQFLLVPKGVNSNSNSGYVGNVPTITKIEYIDGSLSLNGNNLTITLPQIKNTLSGNVTHVFYTKMICDLYYIG